MRLHDRPASMSSLVALGLTVITLAWSGATIDAARPGKHRAGPARSAPPAPQARPAEPDAAAKHRILENYGRLSLSFEKNEGQTDRRVEFISRGRGYTMFLTRGGEAVMALSGAGSFGPGEALPAAMSSTADPRKLLRAGGVKTGRKEKADTGAVLRLKLAGANLKARAAGRQELPGKVNYLRGKDQNRWVTGISTYARVAYEDVYPGIDLVYYGNQRQLEYDFIVKPGADPRAIAIDVDGADRVELDAAGDLLMHVRGRQVRQRKPIIYQEIRGVRTAIDGRYKLEGRQRVKFELAAYDLGQPLVIDPTLDYSTYLGGSGDDKGYGVAVDSIGSAYVTGSTSSTEFPTEAGFEMSFQGSTDAFVTKLDPTGATLIYSTYLGGSGDDLGLGVAIDLENSAHVTGFTTSTDFPISPGAFQMVSKGNGDAFVTKLDTTGAALTYSTYLGGEGGDIGYGLAVDMTGAYVTGFTSSVSFPTTPGAFDSWFNGSTDAFVTKVHPSGTMLLYSTYLGGKGDDVGYGVAVDLSGAYVTGHTTSADFPATMAAYDPVANGNFDAFITKLDHTGAALAYSTYLGGSSDDEGQGVAVDVTGSAYVTGHTRSGDFPTTTGAYDRVANGDIDAFVTKLSREGTALDYSTYLGGGFEDRGLGVAVDVNGNAHVTGHTSSDDFPTTRAYDDTYHGSKDAFVTKVNPDGTTLSYSTYLGGGAEDQGQGIAVDAKGSAYVTGYTSSNPFPVTPGAFDTTYNGLNDVFVSKITDIGVPATLTLSPPADTNIAGEEHCVSATVEDVTGNPVAGVTVRFSVSGGNISSGTATTDTNGRAGFCYTGTVAGADTIAAFADTDNDTTRDLGEPGGTATKTYTPADPATLVVTPPAAGNLAGEKHCVTATVTDRFGNPTPGITVLFTVTGANAATGSRTTDASGQAVFCYTGRIAGADTITAVADTDGDTTQDADEPDGAAAKTYTPAAPARIVATPVSGVNTTGAQHCVTATVTDAFGNPTPGVNVLLTVTGANSMSGSWMTDARGQAVFCYTGRRAGLDTITMVADTNGNNTPEATEPTITVTKTYVVGLPFLLTLSPAAGTNPVDTQHCVTATVTDAFGNPTPGVAVNFRVAGAVGRTGSATTDAAGQATFCYIGPPLPGVDAITAYADTDRDNTQDAGEPAGAAAKTWTLPASTPLCEVAVTLGGRITARNGDKATFGGNAKSDSIGQVSGQQEYQDHGPAQPMTVHSMTVLALVCDFTTKQTSIYGQATIDGEGLYYYRIRISETTVAGISVDTYWIILENGYDSGLQVVEGGKIQIR
jgi:hypothetical protein